MSEGETCYKCGLERATRKELEELQDAIANSLINSDSLHTINVCVPFGEEGYVEIDQAIKASRERADG